MSSSPPSSSSSSKYLILVGNPGSGKSTILNGLVGQPVFESGFSAGTGLTTKLQLLTVDNVTYGDTPGLADVEKREAAAAEISEALRQNGAYRIVFVITLEAGRVRPADITTIKLVLDAVNKDVQYGIIVNKVSPASLQIFEDDESALELLFSSLSVAGRTTPFVFLNPLDLALLDVANTVPSLSNNLRLFLNMLPETLIRAEDVADVQASELDSIRDEMEAKINELEQSAAAREACLLHIIDEEKRRSTSRSPGIISALLAILPLPLPLRIGLAPLAAKLDERVDDALGL